MTISYDAAGNQTRVQDGTGTTTFSYDDANRLKTVIDPANKRITYTYNAAGQRRTMTEPGGGVFTYSYTDAGQLDWLVNPQNQPTTFAYDAAGQLTQKNLANGTLASHTYDSAGQLTNLKNQETTSGTVISSFTYTYDKVGNRTSVNEGSGNTVDWTYDDVYRLRNEKRAGSNAYNTTFSYDNVGNRTIEEEDGALTTYTYDGANQLSTSEDASGTTTYTFDNAGNQQVVQTPTGRTTNTWDNENRRTSVVLPSGAITTSTYRWDGLRYTKQTAGGTKKFIFDGQNYLLETDASNVVQAVFTNSPVRYGNLISQYDPDSAEAVYHHYDALGSTRQLTDSSRSVVNTYIYDAWGQAVSTSESVSNFFRWIGELGYYFDDDVDGYYVRARHYDLRTDQWLSQDPRWKFISRDPIIYDAGDVNLYQYCRDNPLTHADPTGLVPWIWIHIGVHAFIYATWYGNYCGPGSPAGPPPAAIDPLDACCLAHDNCYGRAGVNWTAALPGCGTPASRAAMLCWTLVRGA